MEARLYDFANPAMRKYFLDVVMAPFMEADVCDGVIWDEVTWLLHNEGWPQYPGYICKPTRQRPCVIGANTLGSVGRQRAYADGLLSMVGELSDFMIARKKFPFYSTQTHLNFYHDIYVEFATVLAKHGGGRLYEFFCLNDRSLFPEIGGANSTCLHQVLTLQYEASLGIPAVVHAVWGPVAQPPHDTLEFGLAAFLVAAGEYQYFTWGPENSWRLRDDQHGPSFLLHDEYKRKLGAPLGLAVRNGTQFTRQFAHASVWVDVNYRAANITWVDHRELIV